ncbi:hypothetical protein HPB50_024632 [Hyalomma asiaticum]|uniref:Uncharacterized protein n=1 Tax=Hyalomma asiaticum TaxID=266040 RepID=A0ACB7SA98_HYAAI|nr:hypothetical protein HPB50_024632 [Hyalomma asiaticum]
MIPRLHPPLRPFKPGQRGHLAWLDAVLEINGITDEPTKHALLSSLPADLQYLAAASTASPRPYNALRAAMLAYNGEPYRPPYSEYFASPATKPAVVPSPRPTHASDPPPKPVTTSGTSQPPSSSSLSESMFDVEVERVDCSFAPSTERSSASETSPPALSRVPTSPEHTPTSSTVSDSIDTTDTSPAVRLPAARPLTSTVSPAVPETSLFLSPDSHDDVASESTARKAWNQRSQSRSRLPASQVQAHCNLLPDFRDAAASTNTPTETGDGPLVETPSHSPPSTQPDDQPAALHKPAPLVTPSGSGIAEAPVLLPSDTLSSSLPPEASDTGDATLPAPVDVTTPMVPDRATASMLRAHFRRPHQALLRHSLRRRCRLCQERTASPHRCRFSLRYSDFYAQHFALSSQCGPSYRGHRGMGLPPLAHQRPSAYGSCTGHHLRRHHCTPACLCAVPLPPSLRPVRNSQCRPPELAYGPYALYP